MFSLSLYCLISTSLLFSSITKEYISNNDFYETVSFIYSDKLSQILLLNFTISLALLISKKIFEFFFGNLIASQWQEISNNMNGLFLDMIFIFPAFLYNNSNGSMSGFVVLIPIFFRFLIFLIRSINNGFYISQDSFQPKFHSKIFTIQFALLFSTFYGFCFFLNYFRIYQNPLSCLIGEHCIFSFFIAFSDVIKHLIFLYDINNPGLFKIESIIRYNFLCNLIFEFIIIMAEVIIELYSSSFGLSFYILRPKTVDMLTFTTHLHKYQNWLSLSKMLNEELPDATEEDLRHEDQCIICRLKMKIRNIKGVLKSDAKRLPCGHCYHLSCLQQWIRQQMKCPLCQYDLKQLIEPPEAETTENDDDNFNDFFAFFENLNGHDNIIRNAHADIPNEIENRDENLRPEWRIKDLLTWLMPANDANNENEIHIHHHHHHHHHSTNKVNENNDGKKVHRHRHHHHKAKNNVENSKETNESSINNHDFDKEIQNDSILQKSPSMQNCIEKQDTDIKATDRNTTDENTF